MDIVFGLDDFGKKLSAIRRSTRSAVRCALPKQCLSLEEAKLRFPERFDELLERLNVKH